MPDRTNNRNGTRNIIGLLSVIVVGLGLLHTFFIRPLEVQIADLKVGVREKTADRWTKQDAIRAHDRLEQRIEKCCE